MKFLGKVAIALAGLFVAMASAIITTGISTPVVPIVEQNQATIVDKADRPDGSCSLTFHADGDEFIIDEAPLTCQTLHTGDTISY